VPKRTRTRAHARPHLPHLPHLRMYNSRGDKPRFSCVALVAGLVVFVALVVLPALLAWYIITHVQAPDPDPTTYRPEPELELVP